MQHSSFDYYTAAQLVNKILTLTVRNTTLHNCAYNNLTLNPNLSKRKLIRILFLEDFFIGR
jgi:hypothetical protein